MNNNHLDTVMLKYVIVGTVFLVNYHLITCYNDEC